MLDYRAPRVQCHLAEKLKLPIAVTGFEPADLLYGIYQVIRLKAQGIDRTINAYRRAVPAQGNRMARQKTERFFTPYDAYWRGLGKIPVSGLRLRPEYEQYEARNRFLCKVKPGIQASACRAGEIMKGKISPEKCPLFGNRWYPRYPVRGIYGIVGRSLLCFLSLQN